MFQLNYLAIFVSAILSFIIGAFWYSPFAFGKIWEKLSGFDHSDCEGKKGMFTWIFGQFAIAFAIAWALAILLRYLNYHGFFLGGYVGILAWLGFIATTQFSAVLWAKQHIGEWLIQTSCSLVTLWLVGGILAVWS